MNFKCIFHTSTIWGGGGGGGGKMPVYYLSKEFKASLESFWS